MVRLAIYANGEQVTDLVNKRVGEKFLAHSLYRQAIIARISSAMLVSSPETTR